MLLMLITIFINMIITRSMRSSTGRMEAVAGRKPSGRGRKLGMVILCVHMIGLFWKLGMVIFSVQE